MTDGRSDAQTGRCDGNEVGKYIDRDTIQIGTRMGETAIGGQT